MSKEINKGGSDKSPSGVTILMVIGGILLTGLLCFICVQFAILPAMEVFILSGDPQDPLVNLVRAILEAIR